MNKSSEIKKIHPEGINSLQEALLKKNRSEQILSIAQNDAQEENQGRRLNMLATTGCKALKSSSNPMCLS